VSEVEDVRAGLPPDGQPCERGLERRLHDVERSLAETQRLAGLGSWSWNLTTSAVSWSQELYRLFQVSPEEFEVTFEHYLGRIHPDDQQLVLQKLGAVLDGSAEDFEVDYRIVRADGQVRWQRGRGQAVRDEQGHAVRLFGTAQDITASREVEQQLRAQRDALAVSAAVAESIDDAVIVITLDATISAWNDAATRLYGYTRNEAIGQHIGLILSPEMLERLPTILEEIASGPVRLESRDVRKDGSHIFTSVTLSYVRGVGGRPTGVVGTVRDISEQRRAQEREQAQSRQLAHLAFHDPLTSLANRSLLHDRLSHALASRRGACVSLLLLDLDDFKSVNDRWGHAAGDALLLAVAQQLRECVRTQDTVARMGGAEFVILVEDGNAEQIAERVLDKLSEPLPVDGRLMAAGTSIGLAHSTRDVDADELLLHADIAMYAAKAAGKGRIAHFQPSMAQSVRDRADLQDELRRAVGRQEIIVHYQPVVDVQAGSPLHLEALVRWQRREKLVPPHAFLPLAEDVGLIVDIGREVLRLALSQLHDWLSADLRRSVAVNVSARQLAEPTFAEQVVQLLREHDTPADQLVLEVTESLFLDPSPALLGQLVELRRLGVRVSIDDFGTGYSSLGRLQALPVDCLKIDKSFVELIWSGEEDLPILTSMILMAHSLGLTVTAEGVETAAQAERLVALGCEQLQGYYFARPQPVEVALNCAVEQAAAIYGSLIGGGVSHGRVLLVEDDAVTRAIVRLTLSADGFDVEEAATGAEGLALLGQVAPDLVLVDLGLPDMDGLAVVRAIRAQAASSGTAVVVLTGAAQRDVKSAAFAAGADDYIVKPLVSQHFTARLRGAIRHARHATGARRS
jgi:diguanylate cyclase (GGDEF)-like protein/PAS domain S-box-containing protein